MSLDVADRAPVVVGLAEGLVASVGLALAWGFGAPWLVGPAWPAIVVGALACDRHPHRALAVLVPVALASDILAGGAMGSHLGALALGLLLTQGIDVRGERGRVGHGVFMATMVGGWVVWEMLTSLWSGAVWSWWGMVGVVVWSLLAIVVLTSVFVGVGVVGEARVRARERRSAA